MAPLPAPINSIGAESTPFLHADGKTLYFASSGREGMGGLDLYLSRRTSDSTWSEPQHLPPPLNDHLDNFGLVVRPDGKEAFFARGGILGDAAGRVDLYQLSLPESYRPSPILWWTVWVADRVKGGLVADAQWKISDFEQSRVLDHKGSSYQVALVEGSPRGFQIQAAGYQMLSERRILTERSKDSQMDTLWLQPIESGQRTRLENLYFATDSEALLPQSRPELLSLVAWLKANSKVRVCIEGHTDSVGSSAYNLDLSERRAKGIVLELINEGVDRNQLEYKGYGLSKPIESNQTEQGRARNRRTEVLIL